MTDRARTLNARYGKGMARHEAENSGVAIKIREATKGGVLRSPGGRQYQPFGARIKDKTREGRSWGS